MSSISRVLAHPTLGVLLAALLLAGCTQTSSISLSPLASDAQATVHESSTAGTPVPTTPPAAQTPAPPTLGPTPACSCVGSTERPPSTPSPPLTPRPTRTFEAAEFVITRVGDDVYLIDPNGDALYTRNADPLGDSTCFDQCAMTWPPVTLLPGETAVVNPARFGMIGEIVRADGSRQITFDGKPLYYYSGDTEPLLPNGMCADGWSSRCASDHSHLARKTKRPLRRGVAALSRPIQQPKLLGTCHATRASITPAAPATLTQPTHDLAPGAAHAAR
jgi:predicted lipoprotein with Yx(FWY)xxD motif